MLKFISLIIVTLLTVEVNAEQHKLEEEVLSAFNSLASASMALDTNLYFQHFDKAKFIGLNSDGKNWNSIEELQTLIVNGFKSIEKIHSLEFTNVRVSIIDSYTAVLVNEFEQSMTLKNGTNAHIAGGGSQVWSKRSGQWKLVNVSASNKASPSAQ